MCAFVTQHIEHWPGRQAVLLVHGIGDASAAAAPFPLLELHSALGALSNDLAVYTLNYDFISDWTQRKLQLEVAVRALAGAVSSRFGNADAGARLAEYGGDVLWPVLHEDTRRAIRDALIVQLQQVFLDAGAAALARNEDPLDYRVSIIAHSMGCFHTYELLHAMAREPSYRLRPGTDGTQLASVVLMASPVTLIRTVAGDLAPLVPSPGDLATLDPAGLSLPSERVGRRKVAATRRFVAVTGTQDPVGGHLFGQRHDWGYMDVPGQQTTIVSQSLLGADPVAALVAGLGTGNPVSDPHSWSAYVTGQSALLREALA
ncbi:MAG: hypothetical protein IT355_20745 [Gemmatimonadaceae bacterium]|nr:hypothetical protein [Gemmatimonadaceae bacterium]